MRIRVAVILGIVSAILFIAETSRAGKVKIAALDHPAPQVISWFGRTTTLLNDIDGDGIGEIAIGTPQLFSEEEPVRAGAVFVFSGKDKHLLFTLTHPRPQEGAFFGGVFAAIGDINGDGVGDFAVGARLQDVDANMDQGQVFLFSGSDQLLLDVLDSPIEQEGVWFGASLDSAGDIDGDGIDDLWVGAPKHDLSAHKNAGIVYLFSGRTGELLLSLTDPDPQDGASFGTAVRAAGDLDGDGGVDVVIGAPVPVLGQTENARAYAFSGNDGRLIYSLTTPASVSGGALGSAIAITADLDADGIADIVLGAPAADGPERNQGRAFMYSGRTGEWIRTLEDPTPIENGSFGAAVAAVGDIDGDGTPDVAVGAPALFSDSQGNINSGEVLIFSGATGELLIVIDNPSPDAGASFGFSINSLGDIDGDGRPDLIVGAPFHNVLNDGRRNATQGEAFLFRKLAVDLKGNIADIRRDLRSSDSSMVTFTVSVKNKGTVPSTIPFKVKVHVSVDEVFDGSKVDPKVLTWNVQPPLEPGEEREITGEIELDNATPGNFIIIRVDTKDVIAERNENNNMKVVQIPN